MSAFCVLLTTKVILARHDARYSAWEHSSHFAKASVTSLLPTVAATSRTCRSLVLRSMRACVADPRPDRNGYTANPDCCVGPMAPALGRRRETPEAKQARRPRELETRGATLSAREAHNRRRRRAKIPVADGQPLTRPGRSNEVWSMDFVFDRDRFGRVPKPLTINDDATRAFGSIGKPSRASS